MTKWVPTLISSIAFALYVLCPRMTAIIATQSKMKNLNPYTVIFFGCLIAIPLFALMLQSLLRIGVEFAIFVAATADFAAAALLGVIDLKSGVELLIITAFVYAGIKLAPIITGVIFG